MRDAQRQAVAGILATMEEHFAAGSKRPQSPVPQPAAKRSKLKDLGDMDFGSDASSDDESDSDYFESLVLQADDQHKAGVSKPTAAPVAEQPSLPAQADPSAPAQPHLSEQTVAPTPGPVSDPTQLQPSQHSSGQPAAEAPPAAISLETYESSGALEALGLAALKTQLQLRGLKCGGTLSERAARLYLLKDTAVDQLDAKHFAPVKR